VNPGAEDQPYPGLDLDQLIGLTPEAATAEARANGVERMRILEVINGMIRESIDLVLSPNRLDLVHEQGRVVYAVLPTKRHAGVWPDRPRSPSDPRSEEN
jgi:hypothetical protein